MQHILTSSLLESIQSEIDKAGGREKLAQIIANENPGYFTYRQRKELDDRVKFLKNHPKGVIRLSWSSEELNIVKQDAKNRIPINITSRKIKRTKKAIAFVRFKLQMPGVVRRRWLDSDLKYLIENYNEDNIDVLCKKLGRSKKAIRGKFNSL